jgi:hypothetical protein
MKLFESKPNRKMYILGGLDPEHVSNQMRQAILFDKYRYSTVQLHKQVIFVDRIRGVHIFNLYTCPTVFRYIYFQNFAKLI